MKKLKLKPTSRYTIDELIPELYELANFIEVDLDMDANAETIDRAIVLLKRYKNVQAKTKSGK